MAGSLTNTYEEHVLNWVRGTSMPSAPATVYAAAFTSAPSDAAGGTEVTGGSYVRKAITFAAPSGGQIANSVQVAFDDATADWGTITAIAIFDASTAGNMIAWATLGSSKTINSGARLVIDAGAVTISLD